LGGVRTSVPETAQAELNIGRVEAPDVVQVRME